LLDFASRGYSARVMQRETLHRCYRKRQEIFQTADLYQEVSDEVRHMSDKAVQRRTRDLERRVTLMGVLIGVPALVLTFLNINLRGWTTADEGLVWWVAVLSGVAGLLTGMLIVLSLGRQPGKPRALSARRAKIARRAARRHTRSARATS
jgi:Mg2+ and Co2+ transporter CorA